MVHKYSQGNAETLKVINPVIPRVCSIKEALRRSMTIDQFTSKLYTMVENFYSKKA